MSEIIKDKVLAIENLIAGLWFNPMNMTTWHFTQIKPEERHGNVLIAENTTPVRGSYLGYEIIWVSDEMIFLDLIFTSIPQTLQYQIWITEKDLKIQYFIRNNPNPQYLW